MRSFVDVWQRSRKRDTAETMSDGTLDFPQFSTKTRDELQRFESRLRDHPGYQEHVRLQAFAHSLNTVFDRNRNELLTPLRAVSTSLELALKLIPGVDRSVRDEFQAEVIQRLHNYVAATMTLVDHSRRLMRDQTGRIAEEFDTKKAVLLENPEVRFIQDLRNFMLHRSLPLLAHRLRLSGGISEEARGESEMLLSAEDLLAWDGWSSASRAWIKARDGDIPLRPLIVHHSALVYEINYWLLDVLRAENRAPLAEANEIIVERNAFFNRTDKAEAAKLTEAWTRHVYPREAEPGVPSDEGEASIG
jgi:hypothetical protein